MSDPNAEPSTSVPVALRGRGGQDGRPAGRRRRTDAERNRSRALQVARRLMEARGIGAVTMDALAEAAGVGKGTLYRAFGSRAGLAEALLDEAERALQERILTGPPPLGPGSRTALPARSGPRRAREAATQPAGPGTPAAGPRTGSVAPEMRPAADPVERLQAFAEAYLDLLRSDAELVLETERGQQGARFHTGAYAFWHAHVAGLLRAGGAPDPGVRAHALMALLAADLYLHLRGSGIDHTRIAATITALVGEL